MSQWKPSLRDGGCSSPSEVAMMMLLLFFISFATNLLSVSGAAPCNSGDSTALLEFKQAFQDPDPRGIFSTWQIDSDCCSWLGVNCSVNGRVQGLAVQAPAPRFGLQPSRDPSYDGVVGGSLGRLSQLEYLTITNVYFNAPAPASLGQLSRLTSLMLFSNNFSGSIPPSFGQLTNLVSVTISSGFGGAIPLALCNWVKIVDLDLSSNSLTGGIPYCVYRWTSISTLRLGANKLSGPVSSILGALRTLTVLDLANNQFSGAIPVTLRRLSNLQILLLSENRLSGSIPAKLGQLKQLFSLDLSQNRLTGTIPSSLGYLPQLSYLALYSNRLVGPIPRDLALLPKIETLQLLNNRLTGCFPREFGNVPAANGLNIDISRNYLTCPLPSNLGNIAEFFASRNYFSGAFPISLTAASFVDLSSNRLDSLDPTATAADFPNTVSIITLDLSNNFISGSLPGWLSSLGSLRTLDVSRNELTAGLTASLLELPLLNEVNISRNSLDQELPSQTFTSVVSSLDASHNKLFGPITESFVHSLSGLLYLDLSFNLLGGTVPADIVRPSLQYLNLADNAFTGTVPSVP